MLIVKGDALVPIVSKFMSSKKIAVIYGSSFTLDEESEEYNLEVTNRVISHMAKG